MKPKRSKMAGTTSEEAHRASTLSYLKNHVNRIIGTPERQHSSLRAADPPRSASHNRPVSFGLTLTPSDHDSLLPSPCTSPTTATGAFENPMKSQLPAAPDSTPRSVDTSNGKGRGTRPRQGSQVLKTGVLYGLPDRHASERHWKPFHVALRGHKLYLYRMTSSQSLRSQTSSTTLPNTPISSTTVCSGGLERSEFHHEAQATLADMKDDYVHEGQFYKGSNRELVKLLLFSNALMVCQRQTTEPLWQVEHQWPLDHVSLDSEHDVAPLERISDLPSATVSAQTDQNGFTFSMTLDGARETYTTPSREVGAAWIKALMQVQSALEKNQRQEKVPVSGSDILEVDGTGKHKDLVVRDSDHRKIRGGTVEALVHELLFQTQGNDEDFTNVFLLTCSVVTTPGNILKEIRGYLDKAVEAADTQQWKTLFMRLLDIFTVYCERLASDVVGDVASGMILILDAVYAQASDENVLQRRDNVKELVLTTIEKNEKACSNRSSKWIDCETAETIPGVVDGVEANVDISNIISTGLTTALFLSIEPDRFAEQVYLFHLSQHHIHQSELQSPLSYVPRPHASTQMLNSLLFTTAAPHFLTKLVRRHVLEQADALPETTAFVARTRLLEHWIRVGLRLADLGDVAGWCAVALGICSVGVVRLRETWKSVDTALVRVVIEDWAGRLVRHGLFTQEVWASGWEDEMSRRFAEVMEAGSLGLRQGTDPRGLPFFGTIRQSADRLRRHFQLEEKRIDFDNCWNIFDVIQGGLHSFKKKQENEKSLLPHTISPPFTVVKILQTFFDSLVTEPVAAPYSFKYLHECSLACEPRIARQRSETNSLFGKDVEPPSASTLVFPEILECYKLFEGSNTESAAPAPAKTHPRKKGSNNSMHSLDMLMGSDSPKKTSHGGVDPIHTTAQLPKLPGRQRRTCSFPPGRSRSFDDTATSITDEKPVQDRFLATDHNKTWLGTLIAHGRRTSLLGTHREGGRKNGEWLLNVHHDKLILKASTTKLSDDRLDTTGNRSAKSFFDIAEMSRTDKQAAYGESAAAQDTPLPLLVNVKAGWLDQLVDVLVHGVARYSCAVKEQWSILLQSLDPQRQKLELNEEEYMRVFFATYRAFCSCADLLRMLLERFLRAKRDNLVAKRKNLRSLEIVFSADKKTDSLDCYDWQAVAQTQLRVLQLVHYWIEHHFHDFVDEVELLDLANHFMTNAQQALNDWRRPLAEYTSPDEDVHNDEQIDSTIPHRVEALETAIQIDSWMEKVRFYFLEKIMSPCYDTRAIMYDVAGRRGLDAIYYQLTVGQRTFNTTLQLATSNMGAFSLSSMARDVSAASVVDTYNVRHLLLQADRAVRSLFTSVTLQEWIQTFDVLEAQSEDLYAWLPTGKSSYTSNMTLALSSVRDPPTAQQTTYHVPPEEVVVSDIFTAIEGARRSTVSPSAFLADDLVLAFPASIQYLYCVHFVFKSWVIHEVTDRDIDLKTRVKRIDTFLRMVQTSRAASQKTALFPDLYEEDVALKPVPGFVEYAVASALLSPEVRLFTKAWHEVAHQHGHCHLDTLESLLASMPPAVPSKDSESNALLLVPSLGWIFERMVELCLSMPNAYEKQRAMLSFDKRRYIYRLLQLIVHAQDELNKQLPTTVGKNSLPMAFLVSPSLTKPSWKALKEYASRESKTHSLGGSLVSRGTSKTQRASIFGRLVGEQLDKLKHSIKERDRVDKDWRDLQQRIQRIQLEQMRPFAKHERKKSKILRVLRSYSMTASAMGIFEDAYAGSHSSLAINQASSVVNLISSTTSEVDDAVFRVVTEEGGQYQFRSENRNEHREWMQLINNASREGTAKRQSVLAAESALTTEALQTHRPEPRKKTNGGSQTSGVYGQPLASLMPDNAIPVLADKCMREIEQRGLEEVGIYRVAGSGTEVGRLKAAFNKNAASVKLGDTAWADINVVGDAFKLFLRELPEPVLTHEKYDEFINASVEEDHDKRVTMMKKVIHELPLPNYTMLKRLIEHFVIVTEFEATNHMYATNLAIVFGPTLLQPAPGPASYATTMSNLGRHQKIVQYLILEYHYLFNIENEAHAHPTDKTPGII